MAYYNVIALLALAAVVSGELSLCKRHLYLARAEQADERGRKCWDHVKVPTCGGRCDSREIFLKGQGYWRTRLYLARAEQVDQRSRMHVKVPACEDRCDSREVSDWQFPFKKSHHPVCVHGSRRPLVVKLRHCDEGATKGTEVFHYIAAEDCRCMVCSSQHTSCEWLPPHSTIVEGIVDETEKDKEEE